MKIDEKIEEYKDLDSVYFCINYQHINKLNEFTNGIVIQPKRVCPKYHERRSQNEDWKVKETYL